MKKDKSLFLLLLLVCTFSSQAQWSWRHPSPQGNTLSKMSFLNGATGWLAGEKGTLLKTVNGGNNWTLQYPGHVDDINGLHFADSLHGFMVAGSEFYYSSNSGQSWNIRFRFPNYTISALFMLNTDTGIVALKDGSSTGQLYKTNDGGLNWIQVISSVAGDINDLALTNSGNGILAGSSGMIMQTTDFGDSWTPAPIGGAGDLIDLSMPSSQVVYVCSNTEVYKSTNAGTSFTAIGNPGSGAGVNLRSIDFFNQGNGIAGCEGGNIYFTSNGGTSWNNYVSDPWLNVLAVIANSASNFYASGTNGSILKSTNAGTNWNNLSSRVSDSRLNSIVTVSTTEAFTAGVAGTILHSVNSGTTWTAQSSNAGGEDLHDIIFINPLTGIAVGSNGTIVKTTDGGLNWNFIFSGIGESLYSLFLSGGTLYTCGANGKIAFSTNNGDSWTDIPNSFSGLGYDFLEIQKFGADTIFISTNQPYIVSTNDNGLSWNLLNNGSSSPTSAMYFKNGLSGWIGTSTGEIFSTTDGGNTWNPDFQHAGNNEITCISFTDPMNGWFFAGNEIYRTANGGTVWGKEINPGNVQLFDIAFLVGNNALAVGDGLSTILARNNDMQLSIPVSIFCTDNSYTLAINANGNWNSGNQFRIELSDEFGDFIFPTTLGSVSATGTTPVLINVPNGLIDGTDYRIRIFSTNPPMWSPLNSAPLEVRTSPDAYIVAGGPTAFCQGSSVTLYALTGLNWVYQWYKDGVLINGATADTLFVDQTGNYTVNVSDGVCDLTSPITDVLVINCSGIAESLHTSAYTLFPNPSKDVIHITSKNNETIRLITITDLSGRIIDQLKPAAATSFTLDIENYQCGMYQLRIDGQKPALMKFVKF